jgi:phage shock protein E
MNWTTIIIVIAIVAVIWIVKSAGQISVSNARELLQKGALVVDVRSPGEFSAGHLSKAVNLPMDRLETDLAEMVPDRNHPILLHCMSGTRSEMAKLKLKGLGYTQVFNLGSYGRARKIAGD